MSKDYMTNTNGYWEYNETKKAFTITITSFRNPEFGTMLWNHQRYEFKVTEQNGNISFTGKKGTLKKRL